MNLITKIFVVVMIILFFTYVIRQLVKNYIEFRFAFLWFGVGIIVMIATIHPQFIAWFADALGVGLPLNLVFFLGLLLNMYITFTINVSISRLRNTVSRNTQYIALLEYRVDALSKSIDIDPEDLEDNSR